MKNMISVSKFKSLNTRQLFRLQSQSYILSQWETWTVHYMHSFCHKSKSILIAQQRFTYTASKSQTMLYMDKIYMYIFPDITGDWFGDSHRQQMVNVNHSLSYCACISGVFSLGHVYCSWKALTLFMKLTRQL